MGLRPFAPLHSAVVYGRLMTRARLEQRSRRTRDLLGRCLPTRTAPLLPAIVFCTLGWYVVEAALSYVALFGLLQLVGPSTALSLMFSLLLLVAASAGFSTLGRTVLPMDQERILLAPLSDRQTYLLSFFGNNVLNLCERVLLLPLVCGVTASAALGRDVSLQALSGALALVAVKGCALSLIMNRLVGVMWVRRQRQGARGSCVMAYVLLSGAAFGIGAFLSSALTQMLLMTPVGVGTVGVGGVFEPISYLFARVDDAVVPFESLA